jgi:putative transposase
MRAVSVSSLCKSVGMSRANWYKTRKRRQRRAVDGELVLALVKEQRQLHPRIGCRKLQVVLAPSLAAAGVALGRDRLFELLGNNDLLVPPPPKSCSTTNSSHCLPVFQNLAREVAATGPNQVWVSDITYVRTDASFVYLALITDRYSRKIVGYHCGDNLEALGCLAALDQALADLPRDRHPIHHSDRGCQYCCHDYVQRLEERGLRVSMTETDHCAENAHAERVNGILKLEYGLGATFRDAEQVRLAVAQGVWLYNRRRPHASLNMRTPEAVHGRAA